MKIELATVALFAGLVAAPALAAGVSYTSAQVSSGQSVYQRNCASCHGGSLEGTNDAPALSGSFFVDYWTGKSVADLYNYMHDFMPPTAPSSLEEAQYAALAAYVLSENGFTGEDAALDPAGDLEAQIIGE